MMSKSVTKSHKMPENGPIALKFKIIIIFLKITYKWRPVTDVLYDVHKMRVFSSWWSPSDDAGLAATDRRPAAGDRQ